MGDSNKLSKDEINSVFLKAKKDCEIRANTKSSINDNAKMDKMKMLLEKVNSFKNPLMENLQVKYVPTLKANQRAKRSQVFKENYIKGSQAKLQNDKDLAFVDSRLRMKSAIRKKKVISFKEPGHYIKEAQRLRDQARLEKLKESVAKSTQQTGIATAVKLATIQPNRITGAISEPSALTDEPDWWDACYMKDGCNLNTDNLADGEGHYIDNWESYIDWRWITDLIEHPIEPKDATIVTEIPLKLTKKECKKLRRQNRAEVQREQQEKIRLGLIKPPPPKVRMANLMRVYGAEAAQNPTKIEAIVRAQEAERRKQHDLMNANRKLTKEESREKKMNKLHEELSESTLVSVYKVKDLSMAAHRFKVEKNATQLQMTGVIAVHPTCSVIVVEGNEKKQRKFQRLMMHRIKWTQTSARPQNTEAIDGDKTKPKVENSCQQVVCMATVKSHAFSKMEFKPCPTELYAREQFRKCDVEHYWDLAYSKEVLQSAGELDI